MYEEICRQLIHLPNLICKIIRYLNKIMKTVKWFSDKSWTLQSTIYLEDIFLHPKTSNNL